MTGTDDKYYECPKCQWVIMFHYNYDKRVYTSLCPFCSNRLEIDKDEYERDNIEIYFKADL